MQTSTQQRLAQAADEPTFGEGGRSGLDAAVNYAPLGRALGSYTGALQEGAWPGRLSYADAVGMALGFVFALVVSLVLGHRKIFWEDEMLGWMMLADPSFHHMFLAWQKGADGGGISFYLTGRGWFRLFGPSEVSYRLYSASCFGVAFVLNWLTVRRFYPSWITAFALFNTYFCSPPIVLHLAEGRFYGLMMLSASLAVWIAVEAGERDGRIAAWCYPLVFVAHALLTTSHLLGVVYSFFVIVIMVGLDLCRGRFHPLLYGSAFATWLLLVPEIPAIRAAAAVGKPWFWTFQPPPIRLFGPLTGFSAEISVLLAGLLVCLVISLRRQPQNWWATLRQAYRSRRGAYVVAAGLLLVAPAFLVEGLFAPSLFINRYMIPASIATALLTAELLALVNWHELLPDSLLKEASRWLAGAALAGVISFWDFFHLPPYLVAQEDYTTRLSALLPKDLPVLLEDGFSFTEIIGRQHDSGVRYLYPLDWDQTVSQYAPRVEVTQYNLMSNWRKAGYFSGSIVDLNLFLKTTPEFLVVDNQIPAVEPGPAFIGNPLALRFAKTPGYTVQRYAAMERPGGLEQTAWLVTHDPKLTGLPVECSATAEVN